MDLGDVRRFSVTSILVVGLLVLWVLLLFMHVRGIWRWPLPDAALERVTLDGWLGLAVAGAALMVALMALVVFAVPEAPPGLAKASVRQVQCQSCKAVFFLRDTGHRPLTHVCPNCRAMGVYEGTEPPVGEPPRPRRARQVVLVDLTCRRCKHRFDVTDTGVRPMKVECPRCRARGEVQ